MIVDTSELLINTPELLINIGMIYVICILIQCIFSLYFMFHNRYFLTTIKKWTKKNYIITYILSCVFWFISWYFLLKMVFTKKENIDGRNDTPIN